MTIITKQCKVCSKEFQFRETPSGVAKGAGKYCSKKCKGIGSRNSQVACRVCGIMFYPGITKRTTCSTACRHESRKTGSTVNCAHCGVSFYLPKARITNGNGNFFCCTDHQISWQGRNKIEYTCKICGDKFQWSPSRQKENNPTYCSIPCRDKDPERSRMLRGMNLKQQELTPNNLEIAGYKLLQDIGVTFEPQKLIADKFLVDAYISDHNIIVQFDGDYWHANPEKHQALDHRQTKRVRIDKSQNAYFAKCGYTVLRFWESDIKKRPEWVAHQISSHLK